MQSDHLVTGELGVEALDHTAIAVHDIQAALPLYRVLQTFLAKHGEGVHHLTFIVRDLRAAVARAKATGLRIVDEDYHEPRWQEAFISPRSAFGTIVQLAQTNLDVAERERHWSVANMST
jgi:catechol 2,3-dioxygenase-like lactoylglutathione lyase family enzyme